MSRLALPTVVVVVAALGLSAPVQGGDQVPVKDGRYAGGGDRTHVYFDVSSRTIPFARVYVADLQPCTGLGGPGIFGSEQIDANGRFSLRDDDTHADQVLKLTGRFLTRNKVKGKLKWTTTDDCPAGAYKFEYRADRFAPVS
jgi:hypothetical protein